MAINARFEDPRENPSGPVGTPDTESIPVITRIVATTKLSIEAQISAMAMFRICFGSLLLPVFPVEEIHAD